jgi:hypothetical protein
MEGCAGTRTPVRRIRNDGAIPVRSSYYLIAFFRCRRADCYARRPADSGGQGDTGPVSCEEPPRLRHYIATHDGPMRDGSSAEPIAVRLGPVPPSRALWRLSRAHARMVGKAREAAAGSRSQRSAPAALMTPAADPAAASVRSRFRMRVSRPYFLST